jgi:hypothetical protein
MLDFTHTKFSGSSDCFQNINQDWVESWTPPSEASFEVLIVYGNEEEYEGRGWMLLRDNNGLLYEVNGSHCSCMGFEGQFNPKRTTRMYLRSEHFPYRRNHDIVKALEEVL